MTRGLPYSAVGRAGRFDRANANSNVDRLAGGCRTMVISGFRTEHGDAGWSLAVGQYLPKSPARLRRVTLGLLYRQTSPD